MTIKKKGSNIVGDRYTVYSALEPEEILKYANIRINEEGEEVLELKDEFWCFFRMIVTNESNRNNGIKAEQYIEYYFNDDNSAQWGCIVDKDTCLWEENYNNIIPIAYGDSWTGALLSFREWLADVLRLNNKANGYGLWIGA